MSDMITGAPSTPLAERQAAPPPPQNEESAIPSLGAPPSLDLPSQREHTPGTGPTELASVNYLSRTEMEFLERQRVNSGQRDFQARLEMAQYIAGVQGRHVSAVFPNLDREIEDFYGDMGSFGTGIVGIINALDTSRRNMRLDVEIGKTLSSALVANTSSAIRAAMERAAELDAQKVDEPQPRGILQRTSGAVGQMLPFLFESAKGAVAGVATGAAIGALATSGVGAPVAAAVIARRAGQIAGSFVQSSRIMAGLSFYQMMEAEDEDGNRMDVGTARALSLGAGALNGLIEAFQLDTLTGGALTKRAFRAAIGRTLRGHAQRGTAAAIGLGFLRTYGTNVGTEVVQELAQESIDYMAYNTAVEVNNSRFGTMIDKQEIGDFYRQMREVAIDTALATGVLGVPGSFREMRESRTRSGQVRAATEKIRETVGEEVDLSSLAEALESNDSERIQQEAEKVAQQVEVSPDEVEVAESEGGYTASFRGQVAGTFGVERDGNTFTFSGSETNRLFDGNEANRIAVISAADKIMSRIYEIEPEAIIEIDETDPSQAEIKRALEDREPELRVINEILDRDRALLSALEEDVANLNAQIAEAGQTNQESGNEVEADEGGVAELEEQVAARQEEIDEISARLQDREATKNALADAIFDRQQTWSKPAEKYARDTIEKVDQNIEHGVIELIKENFRQAYGPDIFDGREVDMFVEMMQFAASRHGTTLRQYVTDTFGGAVVEMGSDVNADLRKVEKRASMRINQGKRVLRFADDADFSSMMHEMGHMFVWTLSDNERAVVARWAGEASTNVDKWQVGTHEKFVEAYFQWINNRQEFSGPLASVFNYFKQFVAKTIEIIKGGQKLSPEMEALFDSMFQESEYESTQAVDEASDTIQETDDFEDSEPSADVELFQPADREESVRRAVESFEPVPSQVLEEYIGTKWARKELVRRAAEAAQETNNAALYESARQETLEDFIGLEMMDGEHDAIYLEDIWHAANVTGLNDGNQRWVNGLSDETIYDITDMVRAGLWSTPDVYMRVFSRNNPMTDAARKHIRTHLLNNATEVRRIYYNQYLPQQMYQRTDAAGIAVARKEAGITADDRRLDLERRKLRRERMRAQVSGEADARAETPIAKMTNDDLSKYVGKIRTDRGFQEARRRNTTIKSVDRLVKEQDKRIGELDSQRRSTMNRMKSAIIALDTAANVTAKDRRSIQYMLTEINRALQREEMGKPFSEKEEAEFRSNFNERVKNLTAEIAGLEEVKKEHRALNKAIERARAARKRTQLTKRILKRAKTIRSRITRWSNLSTINVDELRQIKNLALLLDDRYEVSEFATEEERARAEEVRRFTPNYKTAKAAAIKELQATRPEMFDLLPKKDRDVLGEDSGDLSLEALETLYEEVNRLRQEGRAKLKARRDAKESYINNLIAEAMGELAFELPNEPAAPEPEGLSKRLNLRDAYRSTLRSQRIVDMLDGGAGFEGFHSRLFYWQAKENNNKKLTNIRRRQVWLLERINELGFDFKSEQDMMKRLSSQLGAEQGQVMGTSYTLDAALDIAAGFRNPEKRSAIILGNGRDYILDRLRQQGLIDPNKLTKEGLTQRDAVIFNASQELEREYQALIDSIDPQFAALVDVIIAEYQNEYDRLEQATGLFENMILGYEANYTPIVVRGRNTEVHEKQLREEILVRSGMKRAGLDRGMTIDRIKNIKLEHRRPINLGLFDTWRVTSDKQEHYMAHRDWQNIMSAFLRNNAGFEWRQRIERGAPSGKSILTELDRYVSEGVISPQAMKIDGEIGKIAKIGRSGAAVAYLAANFVTVLKQAPSLAFYLSDAGPGNLMAAAAEMARDHKGFMEKAIARNPELWDLKMDRDFDRMMDLLERSDVSKLKKNLADWGTKLIRVIDLHVKAIGEEAVYQNVISRTDENGMQLYSPSEASQMAQNVTNRTQPVGGAAETSSIFKNPTFYLFTQFSNQLNQIWNMATYDIPSGYSKKQFRRQRMGSLIAIGISSYLIWALTNRQALPDTEDPEDTINLVFSQMINSVPVAGPIIFSQMQGFTPEQPALSAFAAVGTIARAGIEVAKGDLSEGEARFAIDALVEGAAITLGVPYIAPKRVIKAIDGMVGGEYDMVQGISTAITGGVFTLMGDE